MLLYPEPPLLFTHGFVNRASLASDPLIDLLSRLVYSRLKLSCPAYCCTPKPGTYIDRGAGSACNLT
jgi:hypothetical protein